MSKQMWFSGALMLAGATVAFPSAARAEVSTGGVTATAPTYRIIQVPAGRGTYRSVTVANDPADQAPYALTGTPDAPARWHVEVRPVGMRGESRPVLVRWE